MSRLPQGPFKTFTENLRLAKGFVKLQFYVEDFFKTGGKASIGIARKWANEVFEIVGLGPGDLERYVEKQMESELTQKLKKLPRKEVKQKLKEWTEKNKATFQRIVETFGEIGLVYERGLLLQSIAIAVSAFEVYVHDLTVELAALKPAVRERFEDVFAKELRFSDLKESEGDLNRALGEVAAKSVVSSSAESVQRHLAKLVGSDVEFFSGDASAEFAKWRAYRNMASHTAGIVSAEFRKRTGYKGKLGEQIRIKRETAESCIQYFERLGNQIQTSLRQ